jgi:hypothetical protein
MSAKPKRSGAVRSRTGRAARPDGTRTRAVAGNKFYIEHNGDENAAATAH